MQVVGVLNRVLWSQRWGGGGGAVGIRSVLTWAWLGLAGGLLAFAALGQQAVPALTAHVMDSTRTLSAQDSAQLEQKLRDFEALRGAQVVVLLVQTTQPEDIASYANRVANHWKIGRQAVGDGLLVVVALNERMVRLEVSKTLEGAVPDLAAKRIIEEAMIPRFKQADYAGGLDAGLSRVMALVTGDKLPKPVAQAAPRDVAFDGQQLLWLLFFVVPVVAAMARRLLGRTWGLAATGAVAGGLAFFLTASLTLALLAALAALLIALLSFLGVLSGLMRTRRGAGGGGLGGGGLGGGGDFGGGGASGKW